MALVTSESVASACEAIQAEGERPTVARVTAKLGGGSPNKVLPLLNEWKDAQRQGARPAPESSPQTDTGADVVTAEMDGAAENLKRGFLAMMAGFVEQERSRAQTAQQAIQAAAEQKVALARQAADQQIADIIAQTKADVDEARAEALAQAEQVEALTEERDEFSGRLTALQSDRDQLAAALKDEQAAHQVAQALADKHGAEVEALRQTVAQAEARTQGAEKAQQTAERRAATAEAAQEKAEQARDQADTERRQVIDQARAQQERDAARIDALTAERDQARQDVAAGKAAADAARRELVERTLAAEAATRTQAEKTEAAQRQAAEALASAEGAKAKAEQLAERLAGETVRAADLAKRLDVAERLAAGTAGDGEAAAKPGRAKGAKPKGE
ncbi:DNA-binding protein [Telmatospirillum sp.]|uniref:DNA-binding protein n=1 Tax=Telmatospirillum sp. TaxID=2079197 RepID=UPI00285247B2|nr:DNA-binding protein [Telmatospirillum sp.]MDR3440580.1 DNA-binding protein [Telmatospirillum sp.]